MQPTVIGHRGAAGLKPENTLASFEHAIELGVDAVECDVHLTRDGRVAVIHDDTADRTTDGTGRIAEMTLAEIRALDAGDGQRVPTLEELLSAVAGRCGLLCEIKADAAAAPAAEAVLASGVERDVIFISFALGRLVEVKRRRGDLQVGAVFGSDDLDEIDRALELGLSQVGLYYKAVSPAIVERVRAAGVSLGVWTPNRLSEMKAMIALGVDAITTDRPDILMDYLKR